MALKDKEPTLSQEEIDGFAAMSEEDRRLLIKVQAKLKGWVLRNKNKKRLLEEAQQAGGAYSIFELPTSEKLVRRRFPKLMYKKLARVPDEHACAFTPATNQRGPECRRVKFACIRITRPRWNAAMDPRPVERAEVFFFPPVTEE